MYDLNTIYDGLYFSQSDLATFLGMTRGALHSAIRRPAGFPQQHLHTLLALDLSIIHCDQRNVVMPEILELEKNQEKMLLLTMEQQKVNCEAQIIKLREKLAKMKDDFSQQKKALNHFLYIKDYDKLLDPEYAERIDMQIEYLQGIILKNTPDQQEILTIRIEAMELELEVLMKRLNR